MKLQELELNAFRGATRPLRLPFEAGKRITMIYGENGSGKTSISDALICLCTPDSGSLDDKSGADKSYLLAAGSAASELRIRLHTDQGAFSAAMSGKKIVPRQNETPPTLRHLRRSSVVELATAAPAKRYEQLADYFDLSGIVKSENGLRDLVRNLRLDLDRITRTLVTVENILETSWKNEGSPHDHWKTWVQVELQKELGAEQLKLNRIRVGLDAWNRANISLEKLNATREEGRAAAEARRQAEQALSEQHAATAHSPALLPLLEEARHYLSGAHPDDHNCPLCQQPAGHGPLLEELQRRLLQMNALREASQAAAQARTEHERLQTLWQGNVESLHGDILKFAHALQALDNTPELNELVHELQNPELPPRKRCDLFSELQQGLQPFLNGKTLEADSVSKALDQYGLIRENWRAVLENCGAVAKTAELLTAAEQALQIVETARKSYIESELGAVSAEVDAFYQFLHPGEQLGDVRLFLKEKGKNSLELTARFHEHTDIAPQSLYSESHLDTLALCIFLALAKRYGPADTILLLDDVLSACDERHLERFVELLEQQAEHFAHIFITTHYRPWRERYGQKAAIQLLELLPWTPEQGIRWKEG